MIQGRVEQVIYVFLARIDFLLYRWSLLDIRAYIIYVAIFIIITVLPHYRPSTFKKDTMKNVLQENMHRFGTKNLQEQESNVQTLSGKQLRQQGYKVYHGAAIQDQGEYLVDPKLRVATRVQSTGVHLHAPAKQLINALTPKQEQRLALSPQRSIDRPALILFRVIKADEKGFNIDFSSGDPLSVVLQYVELAK